MPTTPFPVPLVSAGNTGPCTLSYGGVLLAQPTIEILDWVERNISTADIYDFQHLAWPGVDRLAWPFPGMTRARPVRPQTLFWPAGASRWAVGHFFATDQELAQIRQKVFANSTYNPATLLMQDGRTGMSISPNLWMLPPRPIAQPVPPLGQTVNGLWLLTLVDDRFWWWQSAAQITVTEGTTSWIDLLAACETAIGASIAAEPIAGAYLQPSGSLTANYQYVPLLLDAVAYNVGQRIVRRLDGTVLSMAARTARTNQVTALATWTRAAGGQCQLTDLVGVLPDVVAVVFPELQPVGADPQWLSRNNYVLKPSSYQKPHELSITLASLKLSEVPAGFLSNGGVKVFRDTAQWFNGSNAAQLNELATQIATDWYLWQLGILDVSFAGVAPYQPDGLGDITWIYGGDTAITRVMRGPWPDFTETLNHFAEEAGSSSSSSAAGGTCPGICIGPLLQSVQVQCANGQIETQQAQVFIRQDSNGCITLSAVPCENPEFTPPLTPGTAAGCCDPSTVPATVTVDFFGATSGEALNWNGQSFTLTETATASNKWTVTLNLQIGSWKINSLTLECMNLGPGNHNGYMLNIDAGVWVSGNYVDTTTCSPFALSGSIVIENYPAPNSGTTSVKFSVS